jgi:hypothetical protein
VLIFVFNSYQFKTKPTMQEPITPLTPELVATLDSQISGSWINSFQCITAIRSIIKYHPQFTTDVVCRYAQSIIEFISNGKTQLVKNACALIRETFKLGKFVNVEKCVELFLPAMVKKSAN